MTGSVGLIPSYQAEMGPALEIRRSGVAKTRPNIMQYNPLLRYRSGQIISPARRRGQLVRGV